MKILALLGSTLFIMMTIYLYHNNTKNIIATDENGCVIGKVGSGCRERVKLLPKLIFIE